MKYRYFYTDQGEIVGYSTYTTICFSTGMNDSVGYLDHDQEIEAADYQVDLTTQTLIPRNQ
jgi:hypothetical protein